MQFAKLNGINIHYQVIGAGADAPTVVFANSLGSDFRIWRDVIVALAGNVAIVAYDKRGHGLSDVTPAPYRMDDHVADLAALLDHLSVRDAIVCGISVGGMIAQGLSAARPDLVRALILCCTGHRIGAPRLWQDRIEAVRKGGIAAVSAAVVERWFSAGFHADHPAASAGYRNMLERVPVEGYLGTCAAIRDTDYTGIARRIAVPTLCVAADQDRVTPPELVAELAGLIEGADHRLLDDAGHLPCIDRPHALVDVIKPFLARVSAASP